MNYYKVTSDDGHYSGMYTARSAADAVEQMQANLDIWQPVAWHEGSKFSARLLDADEIESLRALDLI